MVRRTLERVGLERARQDLSAVRPDAVAALELLRQRQLQVLRGSRLYQ